MLKLTLTNPFNDLYVCIKHGKFVTFTQKTAR